MVVFTCVLRILFACNISAFLSFVTDFKNPRILTYLFLGVSHSLQISIASVNFVVNSVVFQHM